MKPLALLHLLTLLTTVHAICKDPTCSPHEIPDPVDPPTNPCPASLRCGTACCESSGFFPTHCVNPSRNLCCQDGEAEVGNTGKCCPRGMILLGGNTCCPPRSILCDGKCCIGTCDTVAKRCRSTVTNAECQALGWAGACATTPRSRECDSCDFMGCCQEWVG